MKALLLLFFAWTSLSQESRLEVFVVLPRPRDLQRLPQRQLRPGDRPDRRRTECAIKSRSLSLRNLNHRITVAAGYLAAQGPEVREAFERTRSNALSLADYLRNISLFLKNRIAYTRPTCRRMRRRSLTQEKGHCIGFANVAQALLACVGIASRPVNGFYLREEGGRVEPVPHRWLEIDLPGERRVFYDPQYQDFSARYLVTNLGVSLESIERFAGVVVRKNKKILDE